MKSLEMCRLELNQIDDEMKELFIKRMGIIEEVTAYKIANNMPVLDESREASMKERLSSDLDGDIKDYYLQLLDTILKVSKDMQRKKIK